MTETNEDLYRLFVHRREARKLEPGELIFNEGDEGDGMFILTRGTVALKHDDTVVANVDGPTLFGEMALIDSEPRSLTAIAVTDAEVVHIPTRHFWVLVHETPNFARLVMSVMAQRLRSVGQTT